MPFKQPTTTPTPDELFDVWLQDLSEGELKVLLYIIRRTLGFRKVVDAISYHQFLKGITTRDGQVLDRGALKNASSLSRALAGLEQKGLIRCIKAVAEEGDKEVTLYSLYFEGDEPMHDPRAAGTAPNVVRSYAKRSTPFAPDVVRVLRQAYQQETEPQETVSQERRRPRARPQPTEGTTKYTTGRYGHLVET